MPTVAECQERLNTAQGLACDECHATTKIVSRVLSGLELGQCDTGSLATFQAEMKRVAEADLSKVYRVDVDQIGHSFAVVQCASKLMLMQSWVSSYTLQEWLIGTDDKLKKNSWLPKNGESDWKLLSVYLETLSKDMAARKTPNVETYVLGMFNPTGPRVSMVKIAIGFAVGNALSVKWANADIVDV